MKNNIIPEQESLNKQWAELSARFEKQVKKHYPRYGGSLSSNVQRELKDDFRHHEFVRQ